MLTPSGRTEKGDMVDTDEPVTISTLKAYVKAYGAAENDLLTMFVASARAMAERITGRTILRREMIQWLDIIPGKSDKWWDGVREGPISMVDSNIGFIELNEMPVDAATPPVITAYDDADVGTPMSSSLWWLDASSQELPARIILRIGAPWPVFIRPKNGFKVAYRAGYTTIPEEIKLAVLKMAAWLYKNRGDCSDDACAGGCGAMDYLRNFLVRRVG